MALVVSVSTTAEAQSDPTESRFVSAYERAISLEQLQFAADFTAEHADLLRLYQAFFGRAPDLDGAKYWMQQWDAVRAAGPTAARPAGHDLLGEFASYFTLVPEFINVYGEPDNETFLTAVYRNMLGREPDGAGFAYWLGFLNGTNPDEPGLVLDKGATMRWVTQNDEFISMFPFGHQDRSPHISDSADCSEETVKRFRNQELTGIYRIRDGEIRELCFGTHDRAVEDAWNGLVQIAEPSHYGPVALLGVFQGDGSGILAYAAGISVEGLGGPAQLFVIAAQDRHFGKGQAYADMTMAHELAHVFTESIDQVDLSSARRDGSGNWIRPDCGTPLDYGGRYCYQSNAFLQQWIDAFWSPGELTAWASRLDTDPQNDVNPTLLCVPGHDFVSTYSTVSPREDFADAFAAYVYGLDKPNAAAKYAFFESRPELAAYRQRAIAAGKVNYTGATNLYEDCVPIL